MKAYLKKGRKTLSRENIGKVEKVEKEPYQNVETEKNRNAHH